MLLFIKLISSDSMAYQPTHQSGVLLTLGYITMGYMLLHVCCSLQHYTSVSVVCSTEKNSVYLICNCSLLPWCVIGRNSHHSLLLCWSFITIKFIQWYSVLWKIRRAEHGQGVSLSLWVYNSSVHRTSEYSIAKYLMETCSNRLNHHVTDCQRHEHA